MDQATATIVGAVIGVGGTVLAAIVTLWKARAPQHHIHEYRVVHQFTAEQEPWIRGDSWLARAVRGVGWIAVFVLLMIGINSLFGAATIWFGFPKDDRPKELPISTLLPTGILALLVGNWIAKRIELSREMIDEDADEHDKQ